MVRRPRTRKGFFRIIGHKESWDAVGPAAKLKKKARSLKEAVGIANTFLKKQNYSDRICLDEVKADVEADGSWSWEAADGGEGDWEEELSLQVLPVRQ